MINWITLMISFIVFSNPHFKSNIEGDWKVNSKFYSASYLIKKENNNINALVLYYNDGTTKYKYDSKNKHYAFKDLRWEKDQYVDGVSGATSGTEASRSIEIKKISMDTLQIKRFLVRKPIVEIWTRNN